MPQTTATKPASVYEIVTSQIIKMLSQGVIPWEKEFIVGDSAPRNWLSQKEYTGINRFLLPMRGEYITEKQAKAAGGRIVDWEKNFIVTYFSMIDRHPASAERQEDAAASVDTEDKIPLLRYYRVFHLSNTSGIPSKLEATSPEAPFLQSHPEADSLVADYLQRSGMTLIHQNTDTPRFDADTDTVTLPRREQFRSSEAYYATLFHELVHSTGASSRLNRQVRLAAQNDDVFTHEELTAEMGACMLLTLCNISTRDVFRNRVARIQGWIKAFRDAPRMVIYAASSAEKAVKLIMGTDQAQPSAA